MRLSWGSQYALCGIRWVAHGPVGDRFVVHGQPGRNLSTDQRVERSGDLSRLDQRALAGCYVMRRSNVQDVGWQIYRADLAAMPSNARVSRVLLPGCRNTR